MDVEKLWQTVLGEIEITVSKATYQTQFAQTSLLELKNDVATIGVVHPLMRHFIETRYYSLLKNILDRHTKTNTSLVFVVIPKKETLTPAQAGPLFIEQPRPSFDLSAAAKKAHIKPEFTFETFAVSTTNQMAYAAATAVSKAPGSAYNPLFLYGGVGVGKTHLMQAIANTLLTQNPATHIVYCMGDEFLNEIIEAIQTKSSRQFKQKYRSAQLLLVDDVQFIAGKTTAQEEFFHTFNAIHREGGQIVLTSDRPPSEISRLEERLRSRFEGGLTVDISPPNFELRAAIVNIKAKALGITIGSTASQLVAANVTDTRAMEGFLRRLASEATTRKVSITEELVANLLRIKPNENNERVETNTRKNTLQTIMEAVAEHYSIKTTTLKGPKRDRPIARPRQMFMYLCRVELGLTHEDIGGALGGRDHTTVMHGVETITRELSTNDRLRADLEGIKNRL